MSKFRASDEDIKAFMVAIFTDGAELATAAFDERYVLQEATRLIQSLRADVARGFVEDSAVRVDNESLRNWRATVTTALQREGGAHFADVPDHIRALVGTAKRYAELADAVVGPDRLSVEDRDFWTHEMTVHNARQARADGDDLESVRVHVGRIIEGFETGVFLRNTVNDKSDDWAIRALPFIAALAGMTTWAGGAPKHGIWGNDDAVLEAAKDRAAAKIEAIRNGNNR
jgi:DNA-binding phage protein